MTLDLSAQLSGHVFAYMMVFVRLAACLTLFPGIGESFVSRRLRLMFALSLTFLFYPILLPVLPKMPDHPGALVHLIGIEFIVGIFFGLTMRILMDILATVGAIIGMNMGLSNAMVLNPSLASQSALPAAFLGVAGIVLVFITGLDHLLFRAMMDTYKIFPVGGVLPVQDMTHSMVYMIARTFTTAIEMCAPFMMMELLLFSALGIMQKLMPQIQLFLVVLPAQILGGLLVFSVCAGIILVRWLYVVDDITGSVFIRP